MVKSSACFCPPLSSITCFFTISVPGTGVAPGSARQRGARARSFSVSSEPQSTLSPSLSPRLCVVRAKVSSSKRQFRSGFEADEHEDDKADRGRDQREPCPRTKLAGLVAPGGDEERAAAHEADERHRPKLPGPVG